MLLDSHAWVLWTVLAAAAAEPYLGTRIGKLNTHFHGVSGELYVVDDTTLYLKDFHYDGTGPDAYFWAGSSTRPDHTGFIIPDEKGRTTPLGAYNGQDLVLKLPAGQAVSKIRWFAVWCRKFRANFGDLIIPRNLEIPKPAVLKALPTWDHGVSSGRVSLVDAQTFLVPDFKYDGLGPAAYWWVSKGAKQHRGGTRLLDENGSISIPHDVRVPPSSRQLALAQAEAQQREIVPRVQQVQSVSTAAPARPTSRTTGRTTDKTTRGLNCQVLHEPLGLELRWVLEHDQAVMQLVGRVRQGEYMSFGLSKDDTKSQMVDADAIVAWIDRNGKGHAVDYYLSSKEQVCGEVVCFETHKFHTLLSQCVGNRGSCPDNKISRRAGDSVTMLDAAVLNGYHMVTFRRPQAAQDPNYDQHIYSDGPQAVMWAVGPVNDHSDASYHSVHSQGDVFLDFARQPAWNCPAPDDDAKEGSSAGDGSVAVENTWKIPPVVCPADGIFQMQIGPAGGRKGYQAVTGQVGWGIAWFERAYAGVARHKNGRPYPTAVGRLCEWQLPLGEQPDEYNSFEQFRQRLKLQCQAGSPAHLRWTPDHNTPDLVYYQCYTHRHLGWKIHVVDSCPPSNSTGRRTTG
ncbi:hypothetical protein MRX96_041453 [Rhipicephalus microplus]